LPATIRPDIISSLRSSILILIDAPSHPDCRATDSCTKPSSPVRLANGLPIPTGLVTDTPARRGSTLGRIAEVRIEKVVAGHGGQTRIDLALLANANLVDSRSHVVIDAAPRHASIEFHARSLNRCIFPNADSRLRIVVGAWLLARLARWSLAAAACFASAWAELAKVPRAQRVECQWRALRARPGRPGSAAGPCWRAFTVPRNKWSASTQLTRRHALAWTTAGRLGP
jgi:hypothetical protein